MEESNINVIEVIKQIPEFTEIHPNSVVESILNDNAEMIRCTTKFEGEEDEISYYSPESWKQYNEELLNPNRHIQAPFSIRFRTPEEREELSEFIEEETPKYFDEHKEKEINIKVVSGMIKSEDNYCSDEYDLFYKASFIPLIHPNNYTLIIETGFDIHYERTTFICTMSHNNIYINDEYRTVHCPEEYEIYKKKIYYNKKERMLNGKDSMPWIRFPRTKDGVTIPLLIDRILKGNFDKIYFNN